MDPLGIILLLAAVSCLFLVLQQGGSAWPWKSGKVIGLLFSFAVILSLFGIVQWKLGDDATVPLRLLKDRTILLGSLFLALSNASSYVVRHFHYFIVYFDILKVRTLLMPLSEIVLRTLLFPSGSLLFRHQIWSPIPISGASANGLLTSDQRPGDLHRLLRTSYPNLPPSAHLS